MSSTEPPSFHVRMPMRLKDELQAARGGKSLNADIVQRLERSLDIDLIAKIAAVLQPLLSDLDAEDRAKLVDLVETGAKIIAKGQKKRRSRKR